MHIMNVAVLDRIGFKHPVLPESQQEYPDPLGITMLLITFGVVRFRGIGDLKIPDGPILLVRQLHRTRHIPFEGARTVGSPTVDDRASPRLI